MTITFLGTGTSQGVPVIGCDCPACISTDPKDKRLRTAIMLSKGDKNIVIDVGPDFRQQMLRAKVKRIEAVLLTHEHNDHIMGLDDVRPFNFRYKMDMPIYATTRVQDALKKRFAYAFDENPYPGAPRFQLHTIHKDQAFSIAGFHIIPIEIDHGQLPVMGFRVGDFTYLTDMKSITPEELEKVKGTQTLVIDALHHSIHHSHLSLPESLALIEKIQPKAAYLIHASHKMGRYSEVARGLPTGVTLAYDGLVLSV